MDNMKKHTYRIIIYMLYTVTVGAGILTITTKPQNVAVYVNGNTTMPCEFSSTDYELTWAECITDDNCIAFSRDGTPLTLPPPGAPRYARYSTANRSINPKERYDLVITGAQLEDGGQFRCSDFTNSVQTYAEVIVLNSGITCAHNLTEDNDIKVGSQISITCSISYRGRWAPTIIFKDPSDKVIPDKIDMSTPDKAMYRVIVTIIKGYENGGFSIRGFFDQPTDTSNDQANNTPVVPAPNEYRIAVPQFSDANRGRMSLITIWLNGFIIYLLVFWKT